MLKTIKKVLLSCLSILGLTIFLWTIAFLNPSLSYAHQTDIEFISVHHNNTLDPAAEQVLLETISILKQSELYHEGIKIDLCLNDESFYPKLNVTLGQCLAFALFDKAVFKNCDLNWKENVAETKWKVNEYEHRKFKLSYLVAHEMTHNLQIDRDLFYWISSTKGIQINWKFEGHADYVARQYKNDGLLKSRIEKFLEEEKKEHIGLPVFELEDGTKQIFSYYKYSMVVQYLFDVKNMNYHQLCALETPFEELYEEMLAWNKK